MVLRVVHMYTEFNKYTFLHYCIMSFPWLAFVHTDREERLNKTEF